MPSDGFGNRATNRSPSTEADACYSVSASAGITLEATLVLCGQRYRSMTAQSWNVSGKRKSPSSPVQKAHEKNVGRLLGRRSARGTRKAEREKIKRRKGECEEIDAGWSTA